LNDLETLFGWSSVLASLAGAIYMYRYYFIKEHQEKKE